VGFSLATDYHTRLSFFFDGALIRQETDTNEYATLLLPEQAEPMNLRVDSGRP
jgi:hypothetical protein